MHVNHQQRPECSHLIKIELFKKSNMHGGGLHYWSALATKLLPDDFQVP